MEGRLLLRHKSGVNLKRSTAILTFVPSGRKQEVRVISGIIYFLCCRLDIIVITDQRCILERSSRRHLVCSNVADVMIHGKGSVPSRGVGVGGWERHFDFAISDGTALHAARHKGRACLRAIKVTLLKTARLSHRLRQPGKLSRW